MKNEPIDFNKAYYDLIALCKFLGIEATQKIIDGFQELKDKQLKGVKNV